MKNIFLFTCILFSYYVSSQENQKSKYGLKIPSQKYLDSLPTEKFRPKRSKPVGNFKDLTSLMPIPGNQGNQGSCVAWSVGYGLKSYQERKETANNRLLFSPSFIFNNCKSPFSKCNEGIYYYEGLDYLVNNGICLWEEMPYDENNCHGKPTRDAIRNGIKYKIESWKTIYANQYRPIDNIDEIKSNIYYETPVAISVWLDSTIAKFMDDQSPNKPKFVWQNPLNDTKKEDYYHAMLCVGYNDTTEEFKVLNSYGPNSANNGYIYISYAAFKKAVYEAYYTIDSDNYGRYVNASKASNQKSEFIINDTHFNYYGWLKEGYFVHINNDLKVSCIFLRKSKGTTILRVYDTSAEKEKLIGSYKFNIGDTYEISYQDKSYSLKLDNIGAAGKNPFKSAAFINFVSK